MSLTVVGMLLLIFSSISFVATETVAQGSAATTPVVGTMLGQTFSVDQAGLMGVEVWFAELLPPSSQITGRLYLENGLLLAETMGVVGSNGGMIFRFERIADSDIVEQPLRFTLAPETGTIALQRSTEPYAQGVAIINSVLVPDHDLAFALLYTRTWADHVWPISTMASGRPGLLGWPPFYVLIPYAFLITLAYALGMLWKYMTTD